MDMNESFFKNCSDRREESLIRLRSEPRYLGCYEVLKLIPEPFNFVMRSNNKLEQPAGLLSLGQSTGRLVVSRGQSHDPLLHVTSLMLPPRSARIGPSFFALVVVIATLLTGQISDLQAGEYSILGSVPGDQDAPALSIDATGGFLAWEDNRIDISKKSRSIVAAALDGNLEATGEVIKINHYEYGDPEKPRVLRLSNGNTLFVWEVRQGSKQGIYVRTLDANGKFTSTEELVNTPSLTAKVKQSERWFGYSRNRGKLRTYKFRNNINNIREQAGNVVVAALPDGGAVLAYHAMRQSETNTYQLTRKVKWTGRRFTTNDVLTKVRRVGDWKHDIFLQRLDSAGEKAGDEILVNQYVDNNQRTPGLAVLPNGNIVVTWVCEFPASTDWRANYRVDLIGRVLNSQGEPITDEFPVAMGDELVQANPVVSGFSDGGFSVFWSQQEGEVSRGWDVYGRVFAADASAAGPAFRINEFTTGDQFAPRVVSTGDTQLLIWTSDGQDGSREGVVGRVLVSGVPDGNEFVVNTTTTSRQLRPVVAADGQGRAMVAWAGFVARTGFDLFGRTYALVNAGGAGQGSLLGIENNSIQNLARARIVPPLPHTRLNPARDLNLSSLP